MNDAQIRRASIRRARRTPACEHPELWPGEPAQPSPAWLEWAQKMARAHVQSVCPHCKLWVLWTPKGETMPENDLLERVKRFLEYEGATLGLHRSSGGEYVVSGVFGKEAEDSPMAGGAIHGVADTLEQALDGALKETRL